MINEYLSKCQEVSTKSYEYVSNYLKENDMKAIGMAPLFSPVELVHAAGMIPVGLWGDNDVEVDLARQYFPSFCPSIIFSIMELGLNGTLDFLSGIIVPGMTDTLNGFGQNWKYAVKDIPMISIVYPQHRKEDFGIKYLVEEFKQVLSKLEEISGKKVSDDDIKNSIELFNNHRKEMRRFSKLASKHPNTVDNLNRMYVYKSAQFMPREEHLNIVKKINEELSKLPEETYDGKRIVTTGIVLDNPVILEILEDSKLRIVGDMVDEESILYNTDIPEGDEDGLKRLANQWRDIEGFVAAYDPKKLRGIMMSDLAKQREADGAIFAMMKFSDFEEYDMPICTRDIRDAGYPVITFNIDQQDKNSEQVKTRIQSFSEMI